MKLLLFASIQLFGQVGNTLPLLVFLVVLLIDPADLDSALLLLVIDHQTRPNQFLGHPQSEPYHCMIDLFLGLNQLLHLNLWLI